MRFTGSEGLLRDRGVQEILTWTIPSHLDPTYHNKTAVPFDALDRFLSSKGRSGQFGTRGRLNRELGSHSRGWMFYSDPEANKLSLSASTQDPSEKTHIFVFNWVDPEKEIRCKSDSSLEDNAQGRADSWKLNFTALQQEWEEKGMRTESLHLKQVDFWGQWRWRVPGRLER